MRKIVAAGFDEYYFGHCRDMAEISCHEEALWNQIKFTAETAEQNLI
jgi:hypothetical protein